MNLRPTPALAVSVVALVVAAGGASYAGTRIGTADLQPNAVTGGKIKNGTITGADLSPSLLATLSQQGGPKAWAYVSRDGDSATAGPVAFLAKAYTHGFTGLTHPDTGIYCLTPARGVDVSHSPIQVSVEEAQSAGTNLRVQWDAAHSDCTATQVEVMTFTPQGDDEDSLSDDVAFTVLAP